MELENREEKEDEMLAALLVLWGSQRERYEDSEEWWDAKYREDREWLLYWLSAVFVASAIQHGLERSAATEGASIWSQGHAVNVLSQMRRHTEKLLNGSNFLETIFGEARAQRFVETEFTDAQSAGSEFAKGVAGELSADDLWFAANPVERRCPYCGRLHLQPRSRWKEIYYSQILPSHPEMAIYGEPTRPKVHPHCNCFILYSGESSDGLS